MLPVNDIESFLNAEIHGLTNEKRWASGTTTTNTGTPQTISISGLNFKPSYIIIGGTEKNSGVYIQIASTPTGSTQLKDDAYTSYVNVGPTSNVTKTDGGFTYEITASGSRNEFNTTIEWYAFE